MVASVHWKGCAIGSVLLVVMIGCAASRGTRGGGGEIEAPTAFELSGDRLRRPDRFQQWVHVGTSVTPESMNDGSAPFPGFHSVYLDPASFAHWKETGEFRDGAVLVKQMVSIGTTEEVSGKGYFMGELGKLEVAVKSGSRFAEEPGHWAYFEFDVGTSWATRKPAARCNACHQGAGTQDFVFTKHYPVLRAARSDESAG